MPRITKPSRFGGKIRKAREALGMRQAALGKKAGLPRGQVDVSEIEREEQNHYVRSWRIIEKIRRVLGMQ